MKMYSLILFNTRVTLSSITAHAVVYPTQACFNLSLFQDIGTEEQILKSNLQASVTSNCYLKETPGISNSSTSLTLNPLLPNHSSNVYLSVDKPFKCSLCSYSTKWKSHLTTHIRGIHTKEKPFKCSTCSYAASQKGDVDFHIRLVHNNEKPFKCNICEYSTGRRCDLQVHVNRVHNKEKPFKCKFCSYLAARKGDLTTHIKRVHNSKKPFQCRLCNYSATRKRVLKTHIGQMHKNETISVNYSKSV